MSWSPNHARARKDFWITVAKAAAIAGLFFAFMWGSLGLLAVVFGE